MTSAATGTTETNIPRTSNQQQRVCRFFDTKSGCRAGQSCPYAHVSQQPRVAAEASQQRRRAPTVDSSRIVSKPQPQDPRTFQMGQIKRRFKPEQTESSDGDTLVFSFSPTDPDFPFDLDALQCQLTVPKVYPRVAPRLNVLNKEIPRGFQINIERGFSTIYENTPGATLLGMMNQLDKQLEAILSGEKAETMTIKIVANRDKAPSTLPVTDKTIAARADQLVTPRPPVYTSEQKLHAQSRRAADTRQLEARFGRLPVFQKSSDGFSYVLPLDSPRKATWPAVLQALRVTTLLVPEMYPLEPAAIILDSDSKEARNVEQAFHSQTNGRTLTQLINNLTINMKSMSEDTTVTISEPAQADAKSFAPSQQDIPVERSLEAKPVEDKPHVYVIARPPEWILDDKDEDTDDSFDSDDGTESAESEEEQIVTSSAPLERGILLSLPNLELHGIELMELSTLGITVRCDRCKDTMDVERIRDIERSESCKKCANGLGITFRADLIHSQSVRAGYLDLDGCTVVDLLPSSFVPTCSECSVAHPAITCVRGESANTTCRECHRKMSFRVAEVKFMQLSIANTKVRPTRKKARENLGVTAGTELPRRGRCTHYAKSYRWFRFSCCNKVYACDRCHDEVEEHPNEHANRMLCGYCSREQNYRPEDCSICHAVLIGRRGRGFWEGGKGTRDKAKMSRKDPRKYKRVGGGSVKKS